MKIFEVLNMARGPGAKSAPPVPPAAKPKPATAPTLRTVGHDDAGFPIRSVAPPIPKAEPPQHPAVHVSQGVLKRLVEISGPCVLPEELAQLKALETQYRSVEALISQLCSKSAADSWREQLAATSAAATANPSEILSADSWSYADFSEDRMEKLKALKNSARAVAAQAIPIASAVATRLAESAGKAAANLEATERAQAAEWGHVHQPTRALLELRSLSSHPTLLIPTSGATAPRSILAFAGIKL